MGVTRELAPVLIRQFLHSYWSRATAETVVPHHAIRATRTSFFYKELLTRGRRRAFRSWRGVVLKAFILLFDQKVLMFLTEKVFMNGNQSVLNRFSKV